MKQNLDKQATWLALERASIPFMKDCYARYTPNDAKPFQRAVNMLIEQRPELPFRPEDFLAEQGLNWSPSTRKRLQYALERFGRWAEHRCDFEVLQS